jgi:DNA-binding transcriptional ArsR family regulator
MGAVAATASASRNPAPGARIAKKRSLIRELLARARKMRPTVGLFRLNGGYSPNSESFGGTFLPKPLPSLVSARLATAMSHPTRLHAMKILVERTATPKEIAVELDQPLNNVGYHIKVLKRLGCIELVGVEPAGGGRVTEHFYRATQHAVFDADMWDQLGEKEKLDVVATIMRLISEDLNDAMAAGTFYDPDDNHISRTSIAVDRTGWKEVTDILDRALADLLEVPEAVADRAANAAVEVETFPATTEIIQFRSPFPKESR